MEPSPDVLEPVRKDEEFILYRGQLSNKAGASPVLLLAPASARPALETPKKLEHELSLRDELDSAWAVRPMALSQQGAQTTLVLEDPGGDTLDRLLRGPMDVTQCLRVAVGLATALGGLHKKGLIHEDAFRFGRLGYELVEKRGLTAYQARTHMSFGVSSFRR